MSLPAVANVGARHGDDVVELLSRLVSTRSLNPPGDTRVVREYLEDAAIPMLGSTRIWIPSGSAVAATGHRNPTAVSWLTGACGAGVPEMPGRR